MHCFTNKRKRKAIIYRLCLIFLTIFSIVILLSYFQTQLAARTSTFSTSPSEIITVISPSPTTQNNTKPKDRCERIRELIAKGLLEYVEREGDKELRELIRPLFTHRKLVIWTSDHHSAPVLDLRSLLEPLGVEFIDHTLYTKCGYFCHCDGKQSLRVLNEYNILSMTPTLMADFQKSYPKNDSEIARVDAFAMFYCFSQFEMYRPYNKSIISISALRYEACRKNPKRWDELNGNLSELYGSPTHVIGANNQYDKEYIGYFTGLKIELLPSFCLYSGGYYNPIHNYSYLISAQRDGFSRAFTVLWNDEFNTHYRRLNATFILGSLRGNDGKYETWDWASHFGIVNVPYQTSTMSIFEQYRMCIPLFFPAHATLLQWNIKYRLVFDRTSAMKWGFATGSEIPPHPSQRAIPDPNDERDPNSQSYWLRFSDFYTFPHIVHFSSIKELVEILHGITRDRLIKISTSMRAFNHNQLKASLRFWRRRLVDIARASENQPH